MREQDRGSDSIHQIGRIQRGSSRCVASGGAHCQDIAEALVLKELFKIAKGTGHAAILEGRAGILAIVLEIKRYPCHWRSRSLAATTGVWASPKYTTESSSMMLPRSSWYR